MRRGRYPSSGKPSKQTIFDELERRPGTFTELHERTKLAESTLSEHLKKLEEKGEVVREFIGGKLIYKLSTKALDPVDLTIRHLEALVPPSSTLDSELGRKLLTEPVVAVIVEFKRQGYGPLMRAIPEDIRTELKLDKILLKFDELTLTNTLAQYYFERDKLPELLKCMSPDERKLYFVLKSGSEKLMGYSNELMPFLKKRGISNKKFDELLEWMKPILETPNLLSKLFNWELSSQLDEFSRRRDVAQAQMLLSKMKSGKLSKKGLDKLKERLEKLKGGEKA